MAGHIATAQRTDWNTPPNISRAVNEAFFGPPDLDPCSNATSTVGAIESISLPQDGLSADWSGKRVYVNPPFGKGLRRWVEKCLEARRAGSTVILLLPAAVDTRTWQEIIFPTASAICFYRGRIRFSGAPAAAPMACALAYWGSEPLDFSVAFRPFGNVWR